MHAKKERAVYRAIADPTRRKMLELLAEQAMTKTMLSLHFSISRQAAVKHIATLKEANLVKEKISGRDHWLSSNLRALQPIGFWVNRYADLWEGALGQLQVHLSKNKKIIT